MSNEISSSLNKSLRKMNRTPPIRRVAAHASSSIPLDNINSNEQININTNLSRPSISVKKIKKNSYNLVKQSINKSNNEPPPVLRERSTSSSSSTSKSSNNDSLRSFSADPSIGQDDDDDDASSNDDTNHQWNLDQLVSNITLRQLSKTMHSFFLI